MIILPRNYREIVVYEYHLESLENREDKKVVIANRFNFVLLDSLRGGFCNIGALDVRDIPSIGYNSVVSFEIDEVDGFNVKKRNLESRLARKRKMSAQDVKDKLEGDLREEQKNLSEYLLLLKRVNKLVEKKPELEGSSEAMINEIRKGIVKPRESIAELEAKLKSYENIFEAQKDLDKEVKKIADELREYRHLGKGSRESFFLNKDKYFVVLDTRYPASSVIKKEHSKYLDGFLPIDLYRIVEPSLPLMVGLCPELLDKINYLKKKGDLEISE